MTPQTGRVPNHAETPITPQARPVPLDAGGAR